MSDDSPTSIPQRVKRNPSPDLLDLAPEITTDEIQHDTHSVSQTPSLTHDVYGVHKQSDRVATWIPFHLADPQHKWHNHEHEQDHHVVGQPIHRQHHWRKHEAAKVARVHFGETATKEPDDEQNRKTMNMKPSPNLEKETMGWWPDPITWLSL